MSATEIKLEMFKKQVDAAVARVDALVNRGAGPTKSDTLLPDLYHELAQSLEELQVAQEELHAQNDELILSRAEVEEQRRRYMELFEFAPDAYLETDRNGIIRAANRAAASLLRVDHAFLVPKPFALFIIPEEVQEFRFLLGSLKSAESETQVIERDFRLRSRVQEPFVASVRVAPVRSSGGELLALRWMIRDVSERAALEKRTRMLNEDLEQRVRERTAELERANDMLLAANDLKDEVLLRESAARRQAEIAQGHLAFLAEAASLFGSTMDYAAILAHLARLSISRLADWCCIDARDESGSIRRMVVVHSDSRKEELARELQQFPPTAGAGKGASHVFATGEPYVRYDAMHPGAIADGNEPRRIELIREMGVASCLCVPLRAGDQTIAALTLVRARSETPYDAGDLALAEDLARRAAAAIERARLHDRAQQELAERRRLEVEQEMNRARLEMLNAALNRMITESHHRVKNHLQTLAGLIDLVLLDPARQPTREDLTRLQSALSALAALHDLLTEQSLQGGSLESMDAAELLQKLLAMSGRAAVGRRIESRLEPLHLSTRQATSLALIVSELITNATKHGKGTISVDLKRENGHAELAVSDDGPGFPADFSLGSDAHVGLELVDSLGRRDLGGEVVCASLSAGGARVSLRFPIIAPA